MKKGETVKLKTFSLAVIALILLAMIFLYFNQPADISPLPMFVAGGFGIALYAWLYLFSVADFEYVKIHYKKYLMVHLMEDQSFTPDPKLKTPSKRFFGRWTVYYDAAQEIGYWQDHPLFGGKWYIMYH